MKMGMEFTSSLDETMLERFKQGIRTGLEGGAIIVLSHVLPLVPVDTARLANSWTWQTSFGAASGFGNVKPRKGRPAVAPRETDRISPPEEEYEAVIGTNVEYAPYVEFQPRGKGAHARPGFDAAKPKVADFFHKTMRKAIRG